MNPFLLRLAAWTARSLPAPLRGAFYKLGPFTRLIRRLLNRSASTGLQEVAVSAGALQGTRLVLDLQTEKDCWLGTYEPQLQDAITDFVRPGMTIYDVGANMGYAALMLARAAGKSGLVFAFEALEANIRRLNIHITLNEMEDRILPVHAAVSDHSEPVRFMVHDSAAMGKVLGSAGRQTAYTETIEVPGLALDDFAYNGQNPLPDLVKIDIEGGEVLALPGMFRLLKEARPIVFLELHGQDCAGSAWKVFEQAGYDLHAMDGGYAQIEHLADLDWKTYVIALPVRNETGLKGFTG